MNKPYGKGLRYESKIIENINYRKESMNSTNISRESLVAK